MRPDLDLMARGAGVKTRPRTSHIKDFDLRLGHWPSGSPCLCQRRQNKAIPKVKANKPYCMRPNKASHQRATAVAPFIGYWDWLGTASCGAPTRAPRSTTAQTQPRCRGPREVNPGTRCVTAHRRNARAACVKAWSRPKLRFGYHFAGV